MRYAYRCRCGNTAERTYPMGKPGKAYCLCGKLMEREISVPPVMFVGEGWAGGSHSR